MPTGGVPVPVAAVPAAFVEAISTGEELVAPASLLVHPDAAALFPPESARFPKVYVGLRAAVCFLYVCKEREGKKKGGVKGKEEEAMCLGPAHHQRCFLARCLS